MPKNILISPVLTEKLTALQEQKNQYSFFVDVKANKIEIRNAIEKKFNVKVNSIRSIVNRGKKRAQFTKRGKFSGFKAKTKRAIVTLDKDNKIDLFEAS